MLLMLLLLLLLLHSFLPFPDSQSRQSSSPSSSAVRACSPVSACALSSQVAPSAHAALLLLLMLHYCCCTSQSSVLSLVRLPSHVCVCPSPLAIQSGVGIQVTNTLNGETVILNKTIHSLRVYLCAACACVRRHLRRRRRRQHVDSHTDAQAGMLTIAEWRTRRKEVGAVKVDGHVGVRGSVSATAAVDQRHR